MAGGEQPRRAVDGAALYDLDLGGGRGESRPAPGPLLEGGEIWRRWSRRGWWHESGSAHLHGLDRIGHHRAAPAPAVNGRRAGRLGDALVVVRGGARGELEAVEAVGPASELIGQRLVGIELKGNEALGLAGALGGEHGAAGTGGLHLGLAERLADGVGGGLGVIGVDAEADELLDDRAVGRDGKGLDRLHWEPRRERRPWGRVS